MYKYIDRDPTAQNVLVPFYVKQSVIGQDWVNKCAKLILDRLLVSGGSNLNPQHILCSNQEGCLISGMAAIYVDLL